MTNTNKIILSLVGATAAGIAVGMLTAPEKGADIRKKIGDTAKDFVSHLSDMINSGKDKISEMATANTRESEDFVNEIAGPAEFANENVG